MGLQPGSRAERRLTDRLPVEEAAMLRAVVARNQPRPPSRRVTIVNVSTRGAGLRVGPGVTLETGRVIEIGIDNEWTAAASCGPAPV